MPNLHTITEALDKGQLQILATNGKWYTARRAGRTQRWKRAPERFRIPIKIGFRTYGELTEATPEGTYRVAEGLGGSA